MATGNGTHIPKQEESFQQMPKLLGRHNLSPIHQIKDRKSAHKMDRRNEHIHLLQRLSNSQTRRLKISYSLVLHRMVPTAFPELATKTYTNILYQKPKKNTKLAGPLIDNLYKFWINNSSLPELNSLSRKQKHYQLIQVNRATIFLNPNWR